MLGQRHSSCRGVARTTDGGTSRRCPTTTAKVGTETIRPRAKPLFLRSGGRQTRWVSNHFPRRVAPLIPTLHTSNTDMGKIVRNVLVRDVTTPGWLRRQTGDEILHPQTTGKVLARGTVYTGYVAPLIDKLLEVAQPFTRGFTLNNRVGPEQTPDVLKMGRVWNGLAEVREALANASMAFSEKADAADSVDLTAVQRSVEQFHATLGTRPFDASQFEASLRQIKDAAANVSGGGRNFRRDAQSATRTALNTIKAGAAQLWGGEDKATRDNAVRSAVCDVRFATDSRSQIAAINRANKAFWDARSQRTLHPIEAHARGRR